MGEPYSVRIGPSDALGSAGGGMTGQPTPAKDLIVELTVDAEELRTLLAEMRALTDELTPWMRWLALQAFEHIDHRPNLIFLDRNDASADPTKWCFGRLEPSKDLVLFVTALRACKGDGPSRVEFEGDVGA